MKKNNLMDENNKVNELIKYIEELSQKFKRLGEELSQTTDFLEEGIKDLY